MRLDSIFKALGVDTVEDIERLTSFFVEGTTDQSSREDQIERAQLIYEDSAILIHPNDVVTAIRKFVETHIGIRSVDSNVGTAQPQSGISDKGEEDDLGMVRIFELVCLIQSNNLDMLSNDGNNTTNLQNDYWNRMANVINEKSYRTWTVRKKFFRPKTNDHLLSPMQNRLSTKGWNIITPS
jgi:dynein regulatory complex protein 1